MDDLNQCLSTVGVLGCLLQSDGQRRLFCLATSVAISGHNPVCFGRGFNNGNKICIGFVAAQIDYVCGIENLYLPEKVITSCYKA